MLMTTRGLLVLVCVATFAMRFLVPQEGVRREDLFKDWGHLLVGGLIGAWLVGRFHKVGWYRLWFWLAVLVTVAEVAAWVLEGKKHVGA